MSERRPVIEVKNVVAGYGSRVILHGVSLEILSGETMVILGGSGSGKSTLLRNIVGLEKPKSGQILIKGVSWTRCAAPSACRSRGRRCSIR
jgi:phospholipid/cholesterol/gamma-HCH transport system ATP-binding protein